MSDTSDRYPIEQTRALGRELGIPMDALMDQVSKALGIPREDGSPELHRHADPIDWDQEPPEGDLCDEEWPYQEDIQQPENDTKFTTHRYLSSEKTCSATTIDGQPCRAYPRTGSLLCRFHDPEVADELREARASGGRRSVYRLPDHVDMNLAHIDLALHNRVGIQASMEAIMRMFLLGRIPPRHAAVLMRYFSGAIRNFQDTKGFALSDRDSYNVTLKEILRTSDLIERDLDDQARNARLDKISDVRAKREEVLMANETFGYLPPSKTKPSQPPSSPRIGYGPNDIRPFHG